MTGAPGRGPGALGRRSSLRAVAGLAPLALARPAAGQGGGAAGRRFVLRASARPGGGGPQGPFRAGDFATVGVFDADWLLDARYARLLDMMAASPGAFRAVRVFGVLNSGEREDTFPTASGRVWPAPDAPMDFSVALAALEALVSRGLVPFLPLTFFPAAVSPSPIEPPAGDARWQELVRAFLDSVVSRFGAAEVARWWFEVWNEPNMPPFWRGDFDRYLRLYRATSDAVRASGHRVRLGGPVIAWMPGGEGEALMARFLEFLRDAPDARCDFLSFHRKGVWTDEEAEPRMERLVEAAEFTAEAALRLVPERCRDGLPIVNDEADMKVGFDRPYEPRLTERFPSWLAAAAIEHAALGARHAARGGGLRFVPAADNANQHLVRAPFDGRRALATRTDAAPDDLVKLPVFAFYELLRLLGERHGSVDAPEDAFFPRTALHHAVTADDDRVAALLTLHPAEGAGARPVLLDYALRDLPWPRANVALFRIDGEASNAYAAAGRQMPAPLPAAAAGPVRAAAELGAAAPLRSGVPLPGGRLRVPVRLPPYATALLWVTPFRPDRRPAAPRWIAAEARGGNAVLRWTPDGGPDFWSYEVLRAAPGGAPPRRVSPVPLRSALWVDTAPPPGAHRYQVRAISASGVRGPASAPSPTVRV
jgi:xylan 1,4-beta-xylosidase